MATGRFRPEGCATKAAGGQKGVYDKLNFYGDFVGVAGGQQFGELRGGSRPAEVAALRLVTFVILQEEHFLLRFHAFGYDAKLHVASHVDDRTDYGRFVRRNSDLTDERLVDFQCVEQLP